MQPGIFGAATFPIFFVTAIALGTAIHLVLVRRAGFPVVKVLGLYAGTALLMLAGAWLFGVALESGSFRWNPGRPRYPGALIALAIGLPVLARWLGRGIPLRRWGDLMVPGAAFALAFLRIDCFLAGCCAGGVSQLPWALSFPAGSRPWYAQVALGLLPLNASWSLPVHPLQLYFLLLALGLGLAALWWVPRRSYDGQIVLLFLAIHEGTKFLLEFLRQPPLPAVQLTSLAVSLAATLALAAIWARGRVHARHTRLEAT